MALALVLTPSSFLFAETWQAGINARGIVESAEISGINEVEVSDDLRNAVRRLIGQPFDQQIADDLVKRLEAEKPELTATTRLAAGDRSDQLKVIFLLEKRGGEAGAEENVNSRYIVERVEVQGYDESKLSQGIRDDLRMLVGGKLDSDKADQILRRIEDELRPKHYVQKRVVKGSDRQHIVVVYDVRGVRWIPFLARPRQHIVYHSKQNFSAAVSANLFDTRNARLYVGLVSDQDQLLERFAGFGVGFEATKIGTDRLGLALRYSRYHNRWQPATVLADANAVYRERSDFEPTLTFAFDPRVRIMAGVSLSELQMQYPAIHDVNSNAAIASLHLQNFSRTADRDRHFVQADYEFRAGNRRLDSEFVYTRHLVRADYIYGHEKTNLQVSFSAGTLAGNAPLLDRFTLGDSSTLRGWNKFDIAPLGGNRMIHGSLQYGFGRGVGRGRIQVNQGRQRDVEFGMHVFYDVGAVGDRGSAIQTRHSVGFGFGPKIFSDFFFELGFPIRSSRVVPVFMMGFRF
jgi:hypothetical protein